MKKLHIKKGDTVKILAGEDRGKTGKVIKSFPKKNKVVVEDINMARKHRKSKKSGEKGQVVDVAMPIDVSNIKRTSEIKSNKSKKKSKTKK